MTINSTKPAGYGPQALMAFFESESFEDAIRNAISIGGDSDTLAL
jgi:type I restriction enzyme M protein